MGNGKRKRKSMVEQLDLQFMKTNKILIENYMQDRFEKDSINFPEEIKEAMAYSLFAGGKRLRPILCMCAAEAIGAKKEEAFCAGYALEMIHTYSLIHDDLPGMDNDDLRRGKPTNHKVFGEGMAILAGDGLLTLAFEVLCDYDAEIGIKLIRCLAKNSGSQGMVGGQVKDILAERKEQPLSLSEIEEIHLHKTGDLITASLLMGGMLAKGSEEELQALEEYGTQFGLAFQITDDILDLIGDESKLGKNVGSDLKNEKATYATLYGIDQAREMAQLAIERALASLNVFSDSVNNLENLAKYLINRES